MELALEYAERHDAEAETTHTDVSKARELLGYELSTSIRENVSKFVEGYRANRKWHEPLVRESRVG